MTDNEMLYCLVAFILGWFVSRQMGNGFRVGAMRECNRDNYNQMCDGDSFCYTQEFDTGYCSKCPRGKAADGANGCY